MTIHALAGKPAPKELLVDIEKLGKEYYTRKPNITNSAERVSFGTSGHRGSSLRGSFNEAHVLAITQAICEYRNSQGINGPLYIGKDTHPLLERPSPLLWRCSRQTGLRRWQESRDENHFSPSAADGNHGSNDGFHHEVFH